MNNPIVIPWHVDWKTVHAIDNGGAWSTALAEKILCLHVNAGVPHVRIDSKLRKWLFPLYKSCGAKVLVGLVWNSLFESFRDKLTGDLKEFGLFKDAYAKWIKYAENHVRDCRPDCIFVDQEWGTINYQHMPAQLREITDKIVGSWTPIYHYRGEREYGDLDKQYGSGPCPQIYYIWDNPLEMFHKKLAERPIKDGYPWISPFKKANELELGLVPLDDWLSICGELHDAGAKGFSMYPSPWSGDSGAIDNPIHRRLVEYMHLGADMWIG